MADPTTRPPLCALEHVSHTFVLPSGQRLEVLRDVSVEIRRRRGGGAARPLGLRQVDHPADPGRPHPADQRRGARARPAAPRAGAGRGHRLPGVRHLPLDDGGGERAGGAAGGRPAAGGGGDARRRRHPHGRPGRLRGGLPARAVGRHEAAGRHGAGAVAPPRGALHGRALQPGGRADRRGAARRDPRHLGQPPAEPLVAAPGVARHQGGGDHGRPDRGPLRQPGPGADRGGEHPAAAARRPLAGGAGAGRPAARPDHRPRAARPARAGPAPAAAAAAARRRRRRSCRRPRPAT